MEVRRISDALKVRASHQADEIAHDDTRRQISFAEWDREADEIGGGLAAAGLVPGDRVFLPISNAHAVEMAIAVFAVFRAGGIACPISTRLNPKEVADYAALCEPRFCLTDAPDLVKDLELAGCWQVDDMPRDIAALPDQADLDPMADAEILGTSGTTGKIKGVVLSHADLMTGVTGHNMDRSRSTLNALPLTGSGGNIGIVMLPARGGATAITQPKFDPKGFLDLAREKGPDLVYLVPSMLRLVLDHPDVATYDMAGVKYLMTGTAPLPHDSVKRAADLWPHLRIRNSYGMSEGGVGIGTRSQEQVLKPGCVGKLPAHMQIRDEAGNIVTEAGVVGEIYGWQKHQRRYWNDPDATAAGFKGGWTKTGDLGFVDQDGDLIMAGRSKELIIRGGYNITPLEIETALHLHPAVQQAAVVGVPHEILGEDIAAAVTLRPGISATADEIIAFCREHVADNKVPRTLVVMDALPLNPNGKILKKELAGPLAKAAAERRKVA
ncbi:acyl-CoA synthetase (AMP-forming)/AMP-acid ligase II [Sphingopyxis panaciterrae]|uniref:class I adenylate-forming enzyme family protein n=1 Tax=Sphingopyxis panaciterrae TaxID=363841 RepID=UPI001420C69D|nr:class I adenylate-forming enzyme family protein [Sphingopyxis panaciterrae]NIJ36730.1 acyl-CoA synthetase (AMP-forming)/AMP-acid ligase II [Sphingopyxis panaciterrae]